MQTLSALVVREKYRWQLRALGSYQRLEPVGHWIKLAGKKESQVSFKAFNLSLENSAYRVKYVEEALAGWKLEIWAKRFNASNRQEHGQWRAESEKVLHFKIELRVFDQQLTSPCQSVFAIVDRLSFALDHSCIQLTNFLHLEGLQVGVDALFDFFSFSFERVAIERLDEDSTRSERYSQLDEVVLGQKSLLSIQTRI